jgi:hypothetical protein
MIILLIVLTWYITKLYYTGKMTLEIHDESNNNVKAICAKCSRYYWIDKKHQRNPFYCYICK